MGRRVLSFFAAFGAGDDVYLLTCAKNGSGGTAGAA